MGSTQKGIERSGKCLLSDRVQVFDHDDNLNSIGPTKKRAEFVLGAFVFLRLKTVLEIAIVYVNLLDRKNHSHGIRSAVE